MMKRLAFVAAMAAGLSAFATDYTWTGAAGGNNWKTNENWVITGTQTVPEVGVWPGGGDKAIFPETTSVNLGEPPRIPQGEVLEIYRGWKGADGLYCYNPSLPLENLKIAFPPKPVCVFRLRAS